MKLGLAGSGGFALWAAVCCGALWGCTQEGLEGPGLEDSQGVAPRQGLGGARGGEGWQGEVPEGLTRDEWGQIQRQLKLNAYRIEGIGDRFEFRNPAQNLDLAVASGGAPGAG